LFTDYTVCAYSGSCWWSINQGPFTCNWWIQYDWWKQDCMFYILAIDQIFGY